MFRSGLTLWDDFYVYDKNRMEELPDFDPICIEGFPYISLRSNPHQASWMLTAQDIIQLNASCNFLTMTWNTTWKNQGFVREYMSSNSIYSNKYLTRPPVNCMVNKVIPAERVEIFKIRHYHRSEVSRANSPSVFEVDESTRKGKHYQKQRAKDTLAMPWCWANVKAVE
jgi:hypothetical protein